MLSGFRHGSLLQLSARRKRNDARRPGRSGRASGNHGNARRSARWVFNFPFIGWNCCQSAKLFWRRRNLARSGTDATEAMRRNARVASGAFEEGSPSNKVQASKEGSERGQPMPNDQEFLLYPLDTGEDPACLDCGTLMMVAGHEVRETKPDFITFRCKRCGRSEKYICDE